MREPEMTISPFFRVKSLYMMFVVIFFDKVTFMRLQAFFRHAGRRGVGRQCCHSGDGNNVCWGRGRGCRGTLNGD